MPISVASRRSIRGLAAPLRVVARRTLAAAGRRAGEVAIVLAGDAELRELNRRWRGLDRATDVLSFEYGESPGSPRGIVNGDVVISVDRAEEQAARHRVSRGEELARLVAHGMLHLAGHDHREAGERRTMRAMEDQVLRSVRPEARRLTGALRRSRGEA